ncbi:MAG: hypothetical protein ACRDTG_30860 [Pseudonocardiaceae bacterium]
MSVAGGLNGSGPGMEGVDLEALWASLRCGRSLPVRHLADSAEAFVQRYHKREVMALCCAEVAESDPDVDDGECGGCRDCLRFCSDCVREAVRFGADAWPVEGESPRLR